MECKFFEWKSKGKYRKPVRVKHRTRGNSVCMGGNYGTGNFGFITAQSVERYIYVNRNSLPDKCIHNENLSDSCTLYQRDTKKHIVFFVPRMP